MPEAQNAVPLSPVKDNGQGLIKAGGDLGKLQSSGNGRDLSLDLLDLEWGSGVGWRGVREQWEGGTCMRLVCGRTWQLEMEVSRVASAN